MENDLRDQAERLKIKIEKLIHLHKSLQSELSHAREENSRLKGRLAGCEDEIKALKQKQAVLKLSNTIGRDEEKKTEVKRKISDLIREIDRCMALLNNPG